jgi:predicted nicotinamide N-methyase
MLAFVQTQSRCGHRDFYSNRLGLDRRVIAPDDATFQRFLETHTRPGSPTLIPEVRLNLALEITPIWEATEDKLAHLGLPPPFWAFCWPGGEALARYILDNPGLVRGRRVLDFACGGGVVAVAAALAGGIVTGCDVDVFAAAALGANCELNGVSVSALTTDPTLANTWEADVILAGDVFYERTMSDRIEKWLRAQATSGAHVLIGDPGRTYLPKNGVSARFSVDVPTSRELEDRELCRTTIWELERRDFVLERDAEKKGDSRGNPNEDVNCAEIIIDLDKRW